jgi:hypothetical protein
MIGDLIWCCTICVLNGFRPSKKNIEKSINKIYATFLFTSFFIGAPEVSRQQKSITFNARLGVINGSFPSCWRSDWIKWIIIDRLILYWIVDSPSSISYQSCQQASFFRPGLAWLCSSCLQARPKIKEWPAAWPGLACRRLQAKPGRPMFLIFQIYKN